jgi:hypothetical protein
VDVGDDLDADGGLLAVRAGTTADGTCRGDALLMLRDQSRQPAPSPGGRRRVPRSSASPLPRLQRRRAFRRTAPGGTVSRSSPTVTATRSAPPSCRRRACRPSASSRPTARSRPSGRHSNPCQAWRCQPLHVVHRRLDGSCRDDVRRSRSSARQTGAFVRVQTQGPGPMTTSRSRAVLGVILGFALAATAVWLALLLTRSDQPSQATPPPPTAAATTSPTQTTTAPAFTKDGAVAGLRIIVRKRLEAFNNAQCISAQDALHGGLPTCRWQFLPRGRPEGRRRFSPQVSTP